MTLDDIRKLRTLQTRTIAAACEDESTLAYVIQCLQRFYKGDYGKPQGALTGSIYIEAHFCADVDISNVDYNNTMICYCDER